MRNRKGLEEREGEEGKMEEETYKQKEEQTIDRAGWLAGNGRSFALDAIILQAP